MARKPVQETPKPLFVRREQARVIGGNIATLFGHKPYKGEVGLEIEVEGNQFPKEEIEYDNYGNSTSIDRHPLIPVWWAYTHDGSLRGDDNAEYILDKPTKFDEVPQAIDELWHMFNEYGSILDESNRTSVHVHLNVQQWYLNRVCSFFGLYFIVEDILTHWCGDHRVGNLFCLRAKDAPGIVSRLKQFFKSEHPWMIDEGLHYSGLNAHALKKLGSVEVRTMRGVNNPETIKTWVAVLERIYRLSGEYFDPREIVHGFSGQTRISFLRSLLGPYTDQIVEECGMTSQEIENSLHEGVRIAQSLCYCRNWSEYEPAVYSPDPFGRMPSQAGDMPEPVLTPSVTPNPAAGQTYTTLSASQSHWDQYVAQLQAGQEPLYDLDEI